MADALKLLIQRKCINKEFSWSFIKCDSGNDNGNRNSDNKPYQKHYCNNKGSNIQRQQQHQQQHDSINNCCSNNLSANNKKMLQQQMNEINMKPFNSMKASATTSASGCASSSCSSKTNDNRTILEFKRKFHLNKLLHMRYCTSSIISSGNSSSSLDQRGIFYITLLIVIYCCVLIRASAATATSTVSAVTITAAVAENKTTVVAAATVATNTSQVIARSMALENEPDFETSKHQRIVRNAANVPDHDDDDSSYHDDEFDEYDALINNKSAKGKYIGAPCNNFKCESTLIHVSCDKETQLCGCEKNYPVQLGLTKGCAKPKKLGEQCFYDETCIYNDENSLCVQVKHNAMCQCVSGFHSVSYTKPTRRVFCTQDLKELKSDLPTLLGVSTGIAVLAGLICMVLHLFSKTKYPRHRNFGDANLPPPIMYSSDTGIPLTVQSGRPSSRSSLRSSGSIGSYGNRRSSTTAQPSGGQAGSGTSAGSKGSRRPSLASVHSTSSSIRSYSMMRFEKESQQKEIRQEMKLRLARLQQQQHMSQNKPQIIIGDALVHHHGALARVSMSTPSPLTPNSLDELLPSVDETQEFPLKTEPSTTAAIATIQSAAAATTLNAAYNGPCSSSTEAL